MFIDIDVAGVMSAEEASLVERARTALLYHKREFKGRSPDGFPYHDVVRATVMPRNDVRPMQIGFKAVPANGDIGQAYLGPDIPLTEDLFDGSNFTTTFFKQMGDACDAYEDYLSDNFAR